MKKELIIAAYDKDLNWLSEINKDIKISIYRKGDIIQLSNGEIKITPNLGRDVHTFFNHIEKNYNNLSDITFFSQDYPFDHWENIKNVVNSDLDTIKNLSTLNINDGYYGYHNNTIGSMHNMDNAYEGIGKALHCYSNGLPHHPNLNVNNVWNILFESEPPKEYEFIPGGHFGVTKETIHIRSKNFYKKLNELLIDGIGTYYFNEPDIPWLIERIECYIFNKNYKTIL
jgi:hypothetical protein